MNVKSKTSDIVKVGFFAAITFLGIQIFRIPLPAAIGAPFVHFGHIFVVLGVLLQGGKYGAVSGTAGLIIFDIVNGFMTAIPQIFIETIIKCLILGWIFNYLVKVLKSHKNGEVLAAVISSAIYGMLGIIIDFVVGIVKLMILGSGFPAAVIGSAASIPATVINAVFMVIVIALLYKVIKKVYVRIS